MQVQCTHVIYCASKGLSCPILIDETIYCIDECAVWVCQIILVHEKNLSYGVFMCAQDLCPLNMLCVGNNDSAIKFLQVL